MSGAAAPERRACLRKAFSLSVHLCVAQTGEVADYITRDISAGGLFIDTCFPLPAGTAVSLQIHVYSLKLQLQAEGTVVRSLPESPEDTPGMAIRFDGDALVGWQFMKQLVEG